MRLLLDTHALLWWLVDHPRLSRVADAAVRSGTAIYVSPISAWEIYLKHRYGKLDEAALLVSDFAGQIEREGFEELPLTVEHAALAARMDQAHRDPFDRMLIAQALLEDLDIVSNDTAFDAFGAKRIW